MRVKFLYPPRLYVMKERGIPPIHPHIVPLGLPVLISFLRENGIKAHQDDIDIRNFHRLRTESPNFIDLSPFLDKQRLARALDDNDNQLYNLAERCLKMTRTRGYDAIGFSLTDQRSLSELGSALLMAKILKEKHDCLVMLGGVGVSPMIHSDLLAKCPFLDVVLEGLHFNTYNLFNLLEEEGEIEESVNAKGLASQRISFDAVRHYRERKQGGFFSHSSFLSGNRKRVSAIQMMKPQTLEEHLPLPVFDGLPLDLYRFIPEDLTSEQRSKMLILPYKFVLGCQFKCAFCSSSGQSSFLHKDPCVVADELEHLSRKYRTKSFFFLNSSCNPTRKFAHGLCDELIGRDLALQWSDCATFKAMDEGLLHKLRQAGAVRLIFGLESGSARMQKFLLKNLELARIEKLLRVSDECGIWTELEVIAGFPHEKWEDVLATEQFLRKNRGHVDYFYLNMFYLPESSLMFSQPSRFGITNLREDPFSEGWAFDEVGRDSWEQSLERRKQSFDYLFAFREKLFATGYYGSEGPFLKLFYLYSMYGEKDKVAHHLKQDPHVYALERLRGPSPADDSYNSLYYKNSMNHPKNEK